MFECTTCGAPATHLYATYDVETKTIHSINGIGKWSPACAACDEPELVEPMTDVFRLQGPIEMWPSLARELSKPVTSVGVEFEQRFPPGTRVRYRTMDWGAEVPGEGVVIGVEEDWGDDGNGESGPTPWYHISLVVRERSGLHVYLSPDEDTVEAVIPTCS